MPIKHSRGLQCLAVPLSRNLGNRG